MKKGLILIFIFIPFIGISQMHQKTKSNFGVFAQGGIQKTGIEKPLFNGEGSKAYGFGITRSFKDVIFPEINYKFQERSYPFNDSLGNQFSLKSQGIGLGLNTKFLIWTISQGKSRKNECKSLDINLLLGLGYTYHFFGKDLSETPSSNEFHLEYGIGFVPRFSGGHKSRQAWTYYIDLICQSDLTKDKDFFVNGQNDWKSPFVGVRVTILYHKTFNFLNVN